MGADRPRRRQVFLKRRELPTRRDGGGRVGRGQKGRGQGLLLNAGPEPQHGWWVGWGKCGEEQVQRREGRSREKSEATLPASFKVTGPASSKRL